MKKTLSVLTVLALILCLAVPGFTAAEEVVYQPPILQSLTHNCPNTGRMLPEAFNPYTTAYVLTVASWVSRVQFTLSAADPQCVIRVNGEVVPQGGTSAYIQMNDNPQQALITVTAQDGAVISYTIFLQRRPSERRTRVSAGYISNIYMQDGRWYVDADLVNVKYTDGNVSSFVNETDVHYKYPCVSECVLYAGDMECAIRMKNMNEFISSYNPGGLYRIVYIEDEIVAILPYAADLP